MYGRAPSGVMGSSGSRNRQGEERSLVYPTVEPVSRNQDKWYMVTQRRAGQDHWDPPGAAGFNPARTAPRGSAAQFTFFFYAALNIDLTGDFCTR